MLKAPPARTTPPQLVRRRRERLLLAAALSVPCLAFAQPGQPAAGSGFESPADPEYRAALALVYDGAFHEAEGRLAALARREPDDPVAPYLQALALEWRLEQAPAVHSHDAEVLALAERALALAAKRLARDGRDGRAMLARGAAHGVQSRLHLFRWQRKPAAREAVRMRQALLAARAREVDALDLDFGLGLYDYYAETLPRFFKLLSVVLGIPGGDRERGRVAIARVARGGSLFHDDEARVQMYDIHTYFEQRPDLALGAMRELRLRYPGWPLWGLKLAELLREPLGLFADSAAVCREILETAERRAHVNYQPVVADMARVLLAEALVLDLRLAEARALALQPACAAAPQWVRARAELVLARTYELAGEGDAARRHYAAAREQGDPASARRAREALRREPPARLLEATRLLARARRLAEAGAENEAEASCVAAFRLAPDCDEARLCAARASLRGGRTGAACALARSVVESGRPWLRPPARLVYAECLERDGRRSAALAEYRLLREQPFGRRALQLQADAALRRLQPGAPSDEPPEEP